MPTWETLQAITQHVQCVDCGVTLCVLHDTRETLELELCATCRAGDRDRESESESDVVVVFPSSSSSEFAGDNGMNVGVGVVVGPAAAAAATTTTCSICLESFINTKHVAVLGCHVSHVFHEACIGAWLEKTPCCPLCRVSVAV